jgi:hypothetical protein
MRESGCLATVLTISRVPSNVHFLVDDFEQGLCEPNVDFIHASDLAGSVKDVKLFLDDAYNCCAYGGWVEMSDFLPHIYDKESEFHRWWELMNEAAEKNGRGLQTPLTYREEMIKRGFVGVTQESFLIPMQANVDEKTEPDRQRMVQNWSMGLEGFSLELMTEKLRMQANKVFALCAAVRKELKDGNLDGYWER